MALKLSRKQVWDIDAERTPTIRKGSYGMEPASTLRDCA